MNVSCHVHECVLSHKRLSHVIHFMCHVIHTWICRVKYMRTSCHKYEWVVSHMNASSHMYERFMFHMSMSHVTCVNRSCHVHEWVMPHIWMGRVTRIRMFHVMYMDESHHTYMNMIRICVMWRGPHSHMRHESFIYVTWRIHICVCVAGRWHDTFIYAIQSYRLQDAFIHVWIYPFAYVTWLIHICDTSLSYIVWHDSFTNVIWFHHICGAIHRCFKHYCMRM